MKVPIQLKIIPILEAVYEVRFETDMPTDTVSGIIFKEFSSDYSDAITLPVKTLPVELRENDINLKYQPHMKMTSNDGKFVLQFGQRVISLHFATPHYDRFENFYSNIITVSKRLDKLNIPREVVRIGLRYVDFFEENLVTGYSFEKLSLDVDIAKKGAGENFSCSTSFTDSLAKHKVQFFKDYAITHNSKEKLGDLIDLDAAVLNVGDCQNFEDSAKRISPVHEEQKKIFFSLIGEEITKLLGPNYGTK
jgi:uncharacterized protein (TIGR04255 family)